MELERAHLVEPGAGPCNWWALRSAASIGRKNWRRRRRERERTNRTGEGREGESKGWGERIRKRQYTLAHSCTARVDPHSHFRTWTHLNQSFVSPFSRSATPLRGRVGRVSCMLYTHIIHTSLPTKCLLIATIPLGSSSLVLLVLRLLPSLLELDVKIPILIGELVLLFTRRRERGRINMGIYLLWWFDCHVQT